MSRARGKKPLAISLFPFLAVLICTMGSLIVLLVLVLQQSRVQASVATAEARDARTANAAVDARTARRDAPLSECRWPIPSSSRSRRPSGVIPYSIEYRMTVPHRRVNRPSRFLSHSTPAR